MDYCTDSYRKGRQSSCQVVLVMRLEGKTETNHDVSPGSPRPTGIPRMLHIITCLPVSPQRNAGCVTEGSLRSLVEAITLMEEKTDSESRK